MNNKPNHLINPINLHNLKDRMTAQDNMFHDEDDQSSYFSASNLTPSRPNGALNQYISNRRCAPFDSKNRSTSNRMSQRMHRHQNQFRIIVLLVVLASIIDTSAGFQIGSPNYARNHRQGKHTLNARSSSTVLEAIKPVQPLKSSTKEKRMSVQKAWEQAQVLVLDEEDQDESPSATPFLDLFTDAGIASVKKIPRDKKEHTRPKGRPQSVAGAMSRTTLLNLNEIEARSFQYLDATKKSVSPNLPTPKKRGRGRPRKNQGPTDDASVDEITSIAATSAMENQNLDDTEALNNNGDHKPSGSEDEDVSKGQKTRKSRVKILPKARKMKESDREEHTTGMMQPARKRGRKGKEDPPNLQRYYRTQLLTQQEEYTLGMKIQFLIKCEQIHEGLFQQLGRAPSMVEWAHSCGFDEIDPIRSVANYEETQLERQIRPIKSEAWEEHQDPNMFVGNGLANETGPGRGRGRAKKAPPTSLKDYYDDSDTKFLDEKPKTESKPINRGSADDFIDLMLTAKEAKQKMVQCNMRLVVSISKRYKHVGVNIADLVQEGSIGLTRAAEKFDPKKGFKFSTYASW